ncbi:MAG: AAA family ATPase [Chloroflexota bacterium]
MAEEKIRVLIVDDIPETRENLRKLLYFETDIEVVAAATDGEEGIRLAKEYQPHVVLMDINMPGVDGIAATEAVTQEVPYCQVIMMSVQGEADYLRRSMLAGARQFLIKPFTGDELVSTIRRVYELGARRPMPVMQPTGVGYEAARQSAAERGKIIAVFSPKGGTGCTVVATNLAVALQKTMEEGNKQVVLMDASLQFGDVGVMMHLQPSRSIADIAPHIDELDQDMFETTLLAHASGVKCLLAPPRPEMADLVTPEHIPTILRGLRRMFDYVVVDTWGSLGDLVLNILDNADRIVLLATPDIPSLANTKLFFEVTQALDYPQEKILLVLNKMDKTSRITAKDISQSLKHPVAAQIVLDEPKVAQSVNRGTPLVLADRRTPFSMSILELAQVIVQSLEAAIEVNEEDRLAADARSGRRVGRLFG